MNGYPGAPAAWPASPLVWAPPVRSPEAAAGASAGAVAAGVATAGAADAALCLRLSFFFVLVGETGAA